MPLTPTNLNTSVSASAQPPHFSSLIGKTLSLDKQHNVVVEEVLAEGGFGVIFLVKNSGDKGKYAMKRVVVNNEKDYEGVVGEVGVMCSLSPKTPHILPSLTHLIVSYPQTSTFELCNLMPLCSKNLLQIASSRMQKQSSFSNEEVLQIFQSVCSGLQYLHNSSPPILHRDIKIENILVLEDTYVLSDFGSATTRVWDPCVDSVQVINEDLDKHTTLLYRSPEMVDLYGGRGAIGVASDVWALGVTGYKLMTFKDPFESILAIQNRNLSWGQPVKAKFSEFVVSLVECCLAEDQSVRPRVEEVMGICGGGLAGDWACLHACVQRISDNLKSLRDEEIRAKVSVNPVVMETTVTPRQRPKRGAGSGGGPAATVVVDGVIPVLAAPPKSPRPVSPGGVAGAGFFGPPTHSQSTTPLIQQTVSPTGASLPIASLSATPSPTPQQPTHSWNPFDEDYAPPTHHCDNDTQQPTPDDANNEDDDPFSKAPFDYFKYQPIVQPAAGVTVPNISSSPSSSFFYYAPNNPFLNYIEDEEEGGSGGGRVGSSIMRSQHSMMMMMGGGGGQPATSLVTSGVCNLSFDDNNPSERGSSDNNNHSDSVSSDSQLQQSHVNSQQMINIIVRKHVGGGGE